MCPALNFFSGGWRKPGFAATAAATVYPATVAIAAPVIPIFWQSQQAENEQRIQNNVGDSA